MTTPATQQPAPSSQVAPLRLVCAELWGGNRPVYRPVELPGLRGVLYSRPCAGGRGGDVHYLSVCGSGLLSRLCLADVVGHGEAVAAVSSTLHDLLRRFMNQHDQRRVLRDLNRQLEQRGLEAMTTAAAVTYYPPKRSLWVSYAGHPPGWFYSRAARRWRRLTLENSASGGRRAPLVDGPLAVDPDATFSSTRVRVATGDRLCLVTDGVLETPSASGEVFGDARLAAILDPSPGASPGALSNALLAALECHAGHADLSHDDVTFLFAELVPGPRGPAVWHAIKNRILRPRGLAHET